jgi:nitrile hydratase subunit beta
MHGLGPVEYEKDEPVFHAPWEGRTYALTRALRALRKWNIDVDRHALDLIAAADYLRMSYYERWASRLFDHVVKFGLVAAQELESGKPAPGSAKATPALTAAMSSRFVNRGIPSAIDPKVPPRFRVGQRVRARNVQPAGHTRIPRYARGKRGTITRDHGVYNFPDTSAHALGDMRQHVYSVSFQARELWGANASARDVVHIDMWDAYLQRGVNHGVAGRPKRPNVGPSFSSGEISDADSTWTSPSSKAPYRFGYG